MRKVSIEPKNDIFVITEVVDKLTESGTDFLFLADTHIDSDNCDRVSLKEHLDLIVKKNGYIIHFGDLFDLTNIKGDPRSDIDNVRKEARQSDYLNQVVQDAADFFEPYKDRILLLIPGNHEESVLKHHSLNILDVFKDKLRLKNPDSLCIAPRTSGFLRFTTSYTTCNILSKDVWYSHGAGGNAPVTRGVIKTNRRQVNWDADMFISAHTHQSWMVDTTRTFVDRAGHIKVKHVKHVQVPSYLKHGRWASSKEFASPVIKAVGVRLQRSKKRNTVNLTYKEWEI